MGALVVGAAVGGASVAVACSLAWRARPSALVVLRARSGEKVAVAIVSWAGHQLRPPCANSRYF